MANCENCIKADVCKHYEPKSKAACEHYSEPVRHGHWIECNYGLTFECSECKYPTEYNLTDYCPNCGAKMDGDKNA